MKTHKKLWDRAFHDTKKYMDYYFSHKAVKSGVYSDYEEDELCAMAYFTPYQAQYMGKNCKVHYIVGVATKSKYRRQRRMTKLLSQGIDVCSQEGSPLVFLSPENPKVYGVAVLRADRRRKRKGGMLFGKKIKGRKI